MKEGCSAIFAVLIGIVSKNDRRDEPFGSDEISTLSASAGVGGSLTLTNGELIRNNIKPRLFPEDIRVNKHWANVAMISCTRAERTYQYGLVRTICRIHSSPSSKFSPVMALVGMMRYR